VQLGTGGRNAALKKQSNMKIENVNDLPIKENPHKADVRMMLKSGKFQVMHLALEPGQSLKPHVTPVEAFFFVIEGEPEVEILDEREVVKANSVVHSPANMKHCIYNPGDKPARVLVVKAGE
jgi:mannose-6-phosphate isomerase-like protein (cupin superfamily)